MGMPVEKIDAKISVADLQAFVHGELGRIDEHRLTEACDGPDTHRRVDAEASGPEFPFTRKVRGDLPEPGREADGGGYRDRQDSLAKQRFDRLRPV